MSFHDNAIFWIDTHKVRPNPYQPRKDFDEGTLTDLADSIRQYGVLQPLVVTRKEILGEDGGMVVEYELIAGERRLRASKIAGVSQIPAVIRDDEEDEMVKLELAIIENLQREDLNPIDRARAFDRLAREFSHKHSDIARKVGKSREYVSNSIRLLALPEEILNALSAKRISEGHTRPLLMLGDRPEEQVTLFKEILAKKMTVRDAERISRRIAFDKVRKHDGVHDTVRPDLIEFEEVASESLGRRVQIRTAAVGGKVMIDYVSDEDLRDIIEYIKKQKNQPEETSDSLDKPEEKIFANNTDTDTVDTDMNVGADSYGEDSFQEEKGDEDDTFSLGSFSI